MDALEQDPDLLLMADAMAGSGPLGRDVVLQYGSIAEVKSWLSTAEAANVSENDMLPARKRMDELMRERQSKLTAKAHAAKDTQPQNAVGLEARTRAKVQELKGILERAENTKDAESAVRQYEVAMDRIQTMNPEHVRSERLKALTGLAAACNRSLTPDPKRTLQLCDAVLELDSENSEALRLQKMAQDIIEREKDLATKKKKRTTRMHVGGGGGLDGNPNGAPEVYLLCLNSPQTFNMMDANLSADFGYGIIAMERHVFGRQHPKN